MRVTVWGEGFLEGESLPGRPPPLNYAGYVGRARSLYPDDVHEALAAALRARLGDGATVRTATLDDAECGLGEELLGQTDVLLLVVAREARRRAGRGSGTRLRARPGARDGARDAARWHGLEGLQKAHGDERSHGRLAAGQRLGGDLDGQSRPPDRERAAAGLRHPRGGDVLRVLRHPPARRARLHQHLRGGRGDPQRVLLRTREGAHLLLPAGARVPPDLPPPARPAGARQRRDVGL